MEQETLADSFVSPDYLISTIGTGRLKTMKMFTYTKFDSGLRDRYLLGGVEDIFGGMNRPLRGVRKKTQQNLWGVPKL
jgi:hypothetical protein